MDYAVDMNAWILKKRCKNMNMITLFSVLSEF